MNITPEFAENAAQILLDIARQHCAANFQKLTQAQVFHKNDGQDIVTQIDINAEIALTRALGALIADSFCLGEEGVSQNLGLIDEAQKYDCVWVIDPLDGTRNFTQGIKIFSCMASLVIKGKTTLALLYDCLRDDVAVAIVGGGAFYLESQQKISNAAAEIETPVPVPQLVGQFSKALRRQLLEAGVKTALPAPDSDYSTLDIAARLDSMRVDRLRCAGMDFIGLAQGIRHFSVYYSLKPWDHAAGKLLLEEAGGSFQLLSMDDAAKHYHPLQEAPTFLACYSQHEAVRLLRLLCLET